MEFDLREIGATILIGAFVFLCCEAYLYYFIGIDLTGFFQGRFGFESRKELDDGTVVPPIPFTVFVGISILIGIFAEDFSVRVVEDRPRTMATSASLSSKFLLGSDSLLDIQFGNYGDKTTIRLDEIVKGLGAWKNADTKPEITVLGRQIGKLSLVGQICRAPKVVLPKSGAQHSSAEGSPEQSVPKGDPATLSAAAAERLDMLLSSDDRDPGPAPSATELKQWRDCLRSIFYFAKNRVYLEPTYYEELERFEIRRHLTASFAVYSSIFAALVPMFMLLGWLSPWRRKQQSSFDPAWLSAVRFGAAVTVTTTYLILIRATLHQWSTPDLTATIYPTLLFVLIGVATVFIIIVAICSFPKSADQKHRSIESRESSSAAIGQQSLAEEEHAERRDAWASAGIALLCVALLVLAARALPSIDGLTATLAFDILSRHALVASVLLLSLWVVFVQQQKRADAQAASKNRAKQRARSEHAQQDEQRQFEHEIVVQVPTIPSPLSRLGIGIVMTVVLSTISLGSLWANHYEVSEMTRRVLGYYISIKRNELSEDPTVAHAVTFHDHDLLLGVRKSVEHAVPTPASTQAAAPHE